jgi:hypothetical protein
MQGGAAVLSDAVYWAGNRAIDPFIDRGFAMIAPDRFIADQTF